MNFTEFKQLIQEIPNKSLGGLEAQFKMAPKMRLQYSEEKILAQNPRQAAVLALFYPDNQNQTRILLTQRASYKGTHSAQISFPGGKVDDKDKNLSETALRETFEEVGIASKNITVFKQMTTTYIPPSNFLVAPFIGFTSQQPRFHTNHEVASTIEVLVSDLLDDNNLSSTLMNTSYMTNIEVPCFKLNNYIIWGATAMILSEIKELIKP